jgi:hypothetical protein
MNAVSLPIGRVLVDFLVTLAVAGVKAHILSSTYGPTKVVP